MKLLSRFLLVNLLCVIVFPATADDPYDPSGPKIATNTENLANYLQNLGSYLGYTLSVDPTANKQVISQLLLDSTVRQLSTTLFFNTFFGAIPAAIPAGSSTGTFQFVPPNALAASDINGSANATFNKQMYPIPTSGSTSATITVNQLLDQQSYQTDPVSQSILNILATPDQSFCQNLKTQSQCLDQTQLLFNLIGPPPSRDTLYDYTNNPKNIALIGQLNSDSLIAPLFFNTTNQSSSTGSPSPGGPQTGLTANNQAQQAANFIRYVSGAILDLASLPQYGNYDNLMTDASDTSDIAKAQGAQQAIVTYLAGLREYAAKKTVGLGNLYYILSKRLPQDTNGGASSQALDEFNMATWRLFKSSASGQTPDNTWVEKINTASAATVQKETAILLAEMNYQMYLERQLQERLLMTISVLQIQSNTLASLKMPGSSSKKN